MELLSIWASIWIWLAALWVAAWQGLFIHNVMKILGKNPKMSPFFLTVTILWVALVESSAIYWLIIAFQVLSAEFVNPLASVWVWLAIWLTWFWVWYGEGMIVKWAAEAMNKNPDEKNKILSFMILFIALVESSAIYWLIVAMQIVWVKEIWSLVSIWAWLAIWLAGLWVAIWEWVIAKKSMEAMWNYGVSENKSIVPFTILWIALVESAAIYWLIISMQIIWITADKWMLAIWAWLAIWLAGLWVAVWEWFLVSKSVEKIWSPLVSPKDMIPVTVLWVALVESWAIYWLIIAMWLLWANINLWITAIWAWLAIWITALWVWLWEWYIWAKAMTSISWNRSLKWKITTYMVLFIALAESVAIYGLVLSSQMMSMTSDIWLASIWVWLAIWLAWFWVTIWDALLWGKALEIIWKRPEMSNYFVTITVLWIALVESAAIYWLVIAFQLTWLATAWLAWLATWLAIWLAWLWVWISEWHIISGALSAMFRNPENKTRFLTFMILFVALVEVLAIYGLIIAFQILGK